MKGASLLDNRIVSTILLFLLLALVVTLWLWIPEYLTTDLKTVAEKGVYGDSYGSVTSLFTGLAFAGLLFTIFLQQREIKLQREDFLTQLEEMKLSRQESNRQTDIHEKRVQLGIAELKMKILELDVEFIKMEGLQWVEHARPAKVSPKFDEVRKKMNTLISGLEDINNT